MSLSREQARENAAVESISPTRLAIYGGSFDPIHNGHLTIARACLQQAQLSRLIFVPAAHSPLKKSGPVASSDDRVQMLELATIDTSEFEVSRYEVDRGGASFSIHTALYFKQMYPDSELFWILGADQFEQLDQWNRIDEFLHLLRLLVVRRYDQEMNPPDLNHFDYQIIDLPLLSESSSLIRSRLRAERTIEDLAPAEVEAFILEKDLYSLS